MILKKNLVISLLIAVLTLLSFSSCTVKWVADYDNELSASIQEIAKTTDTFYLTMLETSSVTDGSRDYASFAEGYASIEGELSNIKLRNQVRALNEHSTRISEIAIEMWTDYKNEHKTDSTISDGIIKLNRMYMQDVFRAMLIAEEGKNFSKP